VDKTFGEMFCQEMAEMGWDQAEPWLREFLPPFLRELQAVELEYNLMGSVVGPWLDVHRPGSKGLYGEGFEDMEVFIEKDEFKVGAGAEGFKKEYCVIIKVRPMMGPECVTLCCHADPAHGLSIKTCAMLIEVISRIKDN